MVFEGDFVARRHHLVDEGEAEHRLQRHAVPVDHSRRRTRARVEIGGDLFVTFRDTPAIEAFVKFLATAPAAEAWAKLGGFGDRQQERAAEHLSRMRSRGRPRRRSRQAKAVVFDMSDQQPRVVRRDDRPGRVGHLPGLPEEPEERRPGSRRSSRRPRRPRTRRASSAWSAGGSRRSRPSRRLRPRRRARHGSAGTSSARSSSRRRSFMLGVWMVYPADLHDHPQLLRPAAASRHTGSGSTTTRRSSRRRRSTTAIKNNAIWVAVVPAFVTALGLIFAVLTERVRWAVAFKTVVFLPMAISAFATGVTWRIMYQQDPNLGAINALGRTVVAACVSPPGVLPSALPSTPTLAGDSGGGLVLKTPLQPGGVAHARPDRDRAGRRCRRARSRRSTPAAKPGDDRRRRLARLQARRRQARRRSRRRSSGCPGVTRRAASTRRARSCRRRRRAPTATFDFANVPAGTYHAGDRRRRRSPSRSAATPGSGRS